MKMITRSAGSRSGASHGLGFLLALFAAAMSFDFGRAPGPRRPIFIYSANKTYWESTTASALDRADAANPFLNSFQLVPPVIGIERATMLIAAPIAPALLLLLLDAAMAGGAERLQRPPEESRVAPMRGDV